MMKKLKIIGGSILLMFVLLFLYGYNNLRDRHPGYNVDLQIECKQPKVMQAGFSAVTITPEYMEPWNDADQNARYEPKKGDTYEDLNGNGKFDTYWIAGFGNRVAAQGVHDDIWARTMVLDDGQTRLALVAVDVIGMFHPMVVDIRNMLPEDAGITYLVVSSTHTHEGPDLMGLWGESPFKSGVDKEWKEYVKKRVVQSVVEAVESLRPAYFRFSQNLTEGIVTLKDTREPYIFDEGLRMMQVLDVETSQTLGTVVQWANHPETLWSKNLLISSDFPHYLREAVEKGIYDGDSLVRPGVGGVTLYVNGAVGGLMTTHSSLGVQDPFRDTVYVEPSFDKIRAQGDTLGLIVLRTMDQNAVEVREAGINLRAKTFSIPLKNKLFRLAAVIGLMDADMNGWMKKRTEAAAWSIGPATFLTFPGELYPEILNGGIDALPGRDFEVGPLEVLPLRDLMKGEFRFGIGLANDEIGYIIPKSQWDVKKPFVYRDKAYYGEENSLGPETAPILYNELSQLLESLPDNTPLLSKIEQARDRLLESIIEQTPADELNKLNERQIHAMIGKDDWEIFANDHWRFTVDKPAIVSVMRHKGQEIAPFWLKEKGFRKTDLTVSNENYEYEVWQKVYPAGEITLGINGFDLHRVVYFVTIGLIDGKEMPRILCYSPDKWKVIRMEKGAYTYNDWDELVIEQLPKELEGHLLFTTIRGRAREAAILNSFRETPYPASTEADQIMLTWCSDPTTSQAVQWRTDTSVDKMMLKYWKGSRQKQRIPEIEASYTLLTDKYIHNNPDVKHWEANITGLTPDTEYNYQIYNADNGKESRVHSFRTAPAAKRPFSFIYLGDTHNDNIVEPVLKKAVKEEPNAAFLIHSGDHVNTGLFRDLWDQYFHSGRDIFPQLPFVPTLGNHDSQDGLPPTLYTQLFMLPHNTDCGLTSGRNYAFTYGDARFYMIDATGDMEKITCWLEKELDQTKEKWKIAVTHFPPYARDDSYPEIRKLWGSLFDKYHVDLVLSGHIHQYFRSYPIKNEQVVSNPKEGTIYVSSVTVESRKPEPPSEKYNEVYSNQGGLYQIIRIDNQTLDFISKHVDGKVIDQFQLKK